MTELKVSVMVFASYREIMGCDTIEVDMTGSGGWTIGELRDRIGEQYPKLSARMGSTLFAVNETMARDDTHFTTKDILAAMPPVSGGL